MSMLYPRTVSSITPMVPGSTPIGWRLRCCIIFESTPAHLGTHLCVHADRVRARPARVRAATIKTQTRRRLVRSRAPRVRRTRIVQIVRAQISTRTHRSDRWRTALDAPDAGLGRRTRAHARRRDGDRIDGHEAAGETSSTPHSENLEPISQTICRPLTARGCSSATTVPSERRAAAGAALLSRERSWTSNTPLANQRQSSFSTVAVGGQIVRHSSLRTASAFVVRRLLCAARARALLIMDSPALDMRRLTFGKSV